MAEYIGREEFLKRIKPYDTEDKKDKALYNFALNTMIGTPNADVVEREKIDKAIDEVYKIRNEVLFANGCYEPDDVLDIIDQITELFEDI